MRIQVEVIRIHTHIIDHLVVVVESSTARHITAKEDDQIDPMNDLLIIIIHLNEIMMFKIIDTLAKLSLKHTT